MLLELNLFGQELRQNHNLLGLINPTDKLGIPFYQDRKLSIDELIDTVTIDKIRASLPEEEVSALLSMIKENIKNAPEYSEIDIDIASLTTFISFVAYLAIFNNWLINNPGFVENHQEMMQAIQESSNIIFVYLKTFGIGVAYFLLAIVALEIESTPIGAAALLTQKITSIFTGSITQKFRDKKRKKDVKNFLKSEGIL